jgi:4-hydroxy-4-methyl-2-oxoglutarate aldolase
VAGGAGVIDAAVRGELERLGSARIAEAIGADAAWTSELRHVAGPETVAGRAYTVAAPPGDNLAIHHAVAAAPRGALLVVATRGTTTPAIWGEILATAAVRAGLAGLVTDGAVRDVAALRRLDLPAFCAGIAPTGPRRADPGEHGVIVELAGLRVAADDWLIADPDAIVVVPADRLDSVLARADERERREAEVLRRVRDGATTLDALAATTTTIEGGPA